MDWRLHGKVSAVSTFGGAQTDVPAAWSAASVRRRSIFMKSTDNLRAALMLGRTWTLVLCVLVGLVTQAPLMAALATVDGVPAKGSCCCCKVVPGSCTGACEGCKSESPEQPDGSTLPPASSRTGDLFQQVSSQAPSSIDLPRASSEPVLHRSRLALSRRSSPVELHTVSRR